MQILYGKKIKSVLYKAHWKTAHNSKFYECLILIELRLNIVLLRIKFTSKILVASFLIRKGCVVVNEKQKQKNYILKVGDTLRLITTFVSNKRKTKIKWRRLKRISNLKKKKMHRLNWGKSLY
jgi:ribosomal protein S4